MFRPAILYLIVNYVQSSCVQVTYFPTDITFNSHLEFTYVRDDGNILTFLRRRRLMKINSYKPNKLYYNKHNYPQTVEDKGKGAIPPLVTGTRVPKFYPSTTLSNINADILREPTWNPVLKTLNHIVSTLAPNFHKPHQKSSSSAEMSSLLNDGISRISSIMPVFTTPAPILSTIKVIFTKLIVSYKKI